MLVRECLARGLPVEVLPGPSAVVTALVASGLPAERWRFAGLPSAQGGRAARRARARRRDAGRVRVAGPRRRARCAVLAELDPEREVAVCRELTKVHEEVVRGTAREVAERFAEGARGEIVLVVGPAAEARRRRRRRRWRRSRRWSRRARGGAPRRRSSPASPAFRRTACTGVRLSRCGPRRVPAAQPRHLGTDGGRLGARAPVDVERHRGPWARGWSRCSSPQPGQTILELAAGTGETGFAAAAPIGEAGKLITS